MVRSVYDPVADTRRHASISDEHLRASNPKAKLVMFGQEINPASYAICKADVVIKGQDVDNIVVGDALADDGHHGGLLFLMHLIKKARPVNEGGGRTGIVLNGSPLFTGGAGSGESNIRQFRD